jgi:hypothetical protein
MMNTLVLVPDGVGIRNFVLGPFLRELAGLGDVHILHQVPDRLQKAYASQEEAGVHWHPFVPVRETPLAYTLRYSLAYAQMYWAGTTSMQYLLRHRPKQGSWRTRPVHRAARMIGRISASPGAIRMLDRWHSAAVGRTPEVRRYRELFDRLRPSVLFCSHQRPPVILAPVLAARQAGIPTATFIFSWDNLTSKGRIAAPFDHFLVWSDLMRKELLQFYPDVAPERVHIVGTPQFDPYADEELRWSREEFFARIGAEPTRPLVCFSGNNPANGPNDPLQVGVLMEFIRSGRIAGRPQVLLRPAPVDDGTRFEKVRRDYPELIFAPPNWVHSRPNSWDHVLPLREDVQFLANLTYHSDLNINFGSTMTLDFAVHDRPVINAAFDVMSPPPLGMPSYDFCMQFEHYRPVVELGASRFSRTPDQFADDVNRYLAQPDLDREGRRRLVELEVSGPIGTSTRRITEALTRIAARTH